MECVCVCVCSFLAALQSSSLLSHLERADSYLLFVLGGIWVWVDSRGVLGLGVFEGPVTEGWRGRSLTPKGSQGILVPPRGPWQAPRRAAPATAAAPWVSACSGAPRAHHGLLAGLFGGFAAQAGPKRRTLWTCAVRCNAAEGRLKPLPPRPPAAEPWSGGARRSRVWPSWHLRRSRPAAASPCARRPRPRRPAPRSGGDPAAHATARRRPFELR